MKINRIAQVGALAAVAALALAGCASNEGGGQTDAPESSLSGNLAGGGASSQEVAQQAWIAGFQTANPDVTIGPILSSLADSRSSPQTVGESARARSNRASALPICTARPRVMTIT